MRDLFGGLGLIGVVGGLIWLVANLIRKNGKKLPIALIAVSFVLFIIASPRYFEQVEVKSEVADFAVTALSRQLTNHESTNWLSVEVIDDKQSNDSQRSHHYLVLIDLEFEDNLGDAGNQSYLIWVRYFPKTGMMNIEPIRGIKKVSIPPTHEEIADFMALVGWPGDE